MMVKSSICAGRYSMKNRMVKAPIFTNSCVDGKITEKTIQHYEERLKGGRFGLVIVEHTYVRKDGMAAKTQLSASDDSDIEGLACLAEIVHKNGGFALLQLNHAGCDARREYAGLPAVSPSGLSTPAGLPGTPPNPDTPEILTKNEILALEDAYIRAAERAMKAGYDGVQIHSAHGYMLNQFYSPVSNRRIDEYNGYTIEGRTRVQREIIRGVRKVIRGGLLSIRIGGCDYDMSGGTTIEDTVRAAKLYEKAGVDIIDISGGLSSFVRPGHTEPGYFGEITEAVKQEVHVPVVLTGGVKSVEEAEQLLREGKADMIGVGRAITADPNWGSELMDSELSFLNQTLNYRKIGGVS